MGVCSSKHDVTPPTGCTSVVVSFFESPRLLHYTIPGSEDEHQCFLVGPTYDLAIRKPLADHMTNTLCGKPLLIRPASARLHEAWMLRRGRWHFLWDIVRIKTLSQVEIRVAAYRYMDTVRVNL